MKLYGRFLFDSSFARKVEISAANVRAQRPTMTGCSHPSLGLRPIFSPLIGCTMFDNALTPNADGSLWTRPKITAGVGARCAIVAATQRQSVITRAKRRAHEER